MMVMTSYGEDPKVNLSEPPYMVKPNGERIELVVEIMYPTLQTIRNNFNSVHSA